jgi:hypothetical protein
MHKFLIYLSIYFSLTCFGLSFSPSSEAGVQFRQWFKSPGYGVSARELKPYPSVYSFITTIHISDLPIAHHQEVTMYICDHWYVLYVLVDYRRAWMESGGKILCYNNFVRKISHSNLTRKNLYFIHFSTFTFLYFLTGLTMTYYSRNM